MPLHGVSFEQRGKNQNKIVRSVTAKVRIELLRFKKFHMEWFSSQVDWYSSDPVNAGGSLTHVPRKTKLSDAALLLGALSLQWERVIS